MKFILNFSIQDIILSGIIILITILASRKIFQKGENLDLIKEYDNFKKEFNEKNSGKKINEEEIKKRFIQFKEYVYNQAFWLVAYELGISLFFLGIILDLRDFFISLLGKLPFIIFLFCYAYVFYRFYQIQVIKSHNLAISNIRELLIHLPQQHL